MSKLSYEERIAAVKEYQAGKGSYKAIAEKYGIVAMTLMDMVATYEFQGLSKERKKYSKELKIQAVNDYLSGKGSQIEICKKYKIRGRNQLRAWIKWYNGQKEFKERSSVKGEIYMTKGRKTTQEERVEIVAFCIEHGKDYGLTTETYNVSYQQIYSWVKKYEEKGVEGLTDRRGKTKPDSELTEEERLRQENKILHAKIKDQEMEIALLKKLRELRGGDW
ncbi:MAG: transposase [Clostridia bacterium]|nr:transposase [Clostridia bacterium]